MKRPMVRFIEEKCDGCGECVPSCAEGAIQIVDGKAKLIDDRYCDGLGACLGDCPQGAIVIEDREAPEFDEEAVKRHLARTVDGAGADIPIAPLKQWPIQLLLLNPLAPFLQGADLCLAADCAAFAHSRFSELSGDRALAIACPKLDDMERNVRHLANLIRGARIQRITILRMEVPCCGGLGMLAQQAMKLAGVELPVTSEIIEIGPAFGGRGAMPMGGGCPSTIPAMPRSTPQNPGGG
ncbi:MAG: 4Fe-4S dicluster domain-containing protein [Planctomycetota bacterium]